MSQVIFARPLTREAFAPFGDLIDTDGPVRYPVNGGRAERIHDLARIEATGANARVLVSIFRGTPYAFPLKVTMVERHPLGSQAFMPLSPNPFVVIVCEDIDGRAASPHAFVTSAGQGVNYLRNIWHGVLTPFGTPQDFLVIDRGGHGPNIEEFFFDEPYEIRLPEDA